MKKPELLSPVGNMDCLKAAVQGGCDAVYLGGNLFGARSFAGNFSNEEMQEAIAYAHAYGVNVYVTVNTLVYENEIEVFQAYIDFLYRSNVDAVIVQDLGMMDWIRKTYPDFDVHASTQMHIHNLEGVKAVESLGLARVVLARETDLDTIRMIQQNTSIQLEIFVHGALCFCYSGQCLMSSMIGGRSGNRGTCTQCCRMPYAVYKNNKKINTDSYIMSPKDLNSLEHLGALLEIGVDSLKIEGRMKRAEYVYYVTKLYRKAIDEYYEKQTITITEEEQNTLKKLFHREYTKGFLFHEEQSKWLNPKRPNHVGIEVGKVVQYEKGWVTCKLSDFVHQNDGIRILGVHEDGGCILNKLYQKKKLVNSGKPNEMISFYLKGNFKKGDSLVLTSDSHDLAHIQKEIENKPRKVKITGRIVLKIGEVIQYQISDGKHDVTIKGHMIVTSASKTPVLKERICEQMQKLGNTIYCLEKLCIEMDDSIFIPIQELNQIRRESIEMLSQKRQKTRVNHKEKYTQEVLEWKEEPGYTIRLFEEKSELSSFKQVYVEDRNLYERWKSIYPVVYIRPRVVTHFDAVEGPIMGGDVGSIFSDHPTYSDFSLNVTNSYTVAFLHHYGVRRVTLSFEMNLQQIDDVIKGYNRRYHKHPNVEVILTEYPEVMITKFDLLAYYHSQVSLEMEDEKKHQFFIRKAGDYSKIYYHKKDSMITPQQLFAIGVNTVCLWDFPIK